MKKHSLLATVVLGVLLLSHGILWPDNPAAMPMVQVTPVTTDAVSPSPTFTLEPSATGTPTPILAITKAREEIDSNQNGIIDGGDIIKYTLTYENRGNTPATNVVIVDDYPEIYIASISKITGAGTDNGKTITWELGTVQTGGRGEITYDARLKDTFAVATDVQNEVTISSDGVVLMRAQAITQVQVAPTPTHTPTPTPTPTLSPTPTSSPTPQPAGPVSGIFGGRPEVPTILLGILAFLAMAVLTFVGAIAPLLNKGASATHQSSTGGDIDCQRIGLVREGVFLVFIVSAVLIMAIGRGIEPDGAISIPSAIAGYVLGRATVTR